MSDKKEQKPWEAPKMVYVGQVSEVLQGGGGKLSNVPTDPGEPQKTPPQA
jgi:hypothetical protein